MEKPMQGDQATDGWRSVQYKLASVTPTKHLKWKNRHFMNMLDAKMF